jgi:CHAT domain-containing protein/predicted negative regulator of RcsB-dependent stress response
MADSLSRTAPSESLAAYVDAHSMLAGAAVAQLLDAGVLAGDAGDKDGERENFALADRVSATYREITNSTALIDLAASYRSWGATERALRRNAKQLEKDASAAQGEKRHDDAIDFLRRSIDIYKKIKDKYSEAVVWGSLGVAAFNKGDFRAVREFYISALEARRGIEHNILVGRTLNGLGTVAFMLEDNREAVEYYLQALEMRRKTGDIGALGTSYTYLGNAYTRLGRLADARDAFEEALAIVERAGNQRQRFELLNSIAGLQSDMGRLRESSESYRGALGVATSIGDAQAEIICRMNLALNLKSEFRFREALAELDLVDSLLASNPDPVQAVLLHRNRGQIYMETGELDRARDDLLAYLGAARENGMEAQEMEAMVKLGYLYLELQAFDPGISLADSVRARAERAGNRPFTREADLLAAQLEQARGNAAAALARYERALERDRADGAERDALQDELGVANATALAGRGADARRIYRSLEPRIRAAGADNLLLTLNLGIGHSFERDDPDSARFYYDRAFDLMERARADIGGAELGSSYLGGMRRRYSEEVARFYARTARMTGDRRWANESFRTMERAKARGLLDLLEGSIVHEQSDAERAVLDSIYRLDPGAPEHADEQRRLERRYRIIRDSRLSSAAGTLAERAAAADPEQLRKALPKGTALLAFAVGDSISLLWAVDRKGIDLVELPPRSGLRDDVAMLSSALTNPAGGDEALRRYARKLFVALLAPANRFLERNSRLIIIPDDCLFEIPFEALLAGDSGPTARWKDCLFLAKSHLVSYAPSGAVYLKLRGGAPSSGAIDLLAVGDPAYGAAGDSAAGRPAAGPPLRRLAHSRDEIEGIGSNYKADKRLLSLGEEATEAGLKARLRELRPNVIHLAAHGIVDPVNPAASCIALLSDSAAGEDGFLHTLEILALPIDARLVTLSACESARGRIGRGEGVVGLSRAFLAAGASCVVSSLWAVSDESTSLLMRAFYKSMISGKRSAVAALNEARLELMRTSGYEHPFYWAPFIAVGSERAPWQ